MSTKNKQVPPTRFGSLASPSLRVAVVSAKPMQELLNEIDQVKIDVETSISILEKIDTGRKKAVANHDRLIEGRIQIKNLIQHIIDLQKQMNVITKESNPN